ncbi:hypothetical protein Efla_002662 [Eimeria flavescens]
MAASAPFKIVKAPPLPAPTGRRPIGFRGNHQHKKALYDPVYPTTKVPSNLVPRYPIDWRNGGRALLVAALHKLEGNYRIQHHEEPLLQRQRPLAAGSLVAPGEAAVGCSSASDAPALGRRRSARAGSAANAAARRLVLRHKRALEWQEGGFCSSRCGAACSKSPWRCLCPWRCRGVYQHANRMDATLMSHKGPMESEKPLFSVKRPEAAPSRWASEGMLFCRDSGRFLATKKHQHPAFEAFDAAEEEQKFLAQRSRAVSWGIEDDLDADSDAEDEVDEEAEGLLRLLAVTRTHKRA